MGEGKCVCVCVCVNNLPRVITSPTFYRSHHHTTLAVERERSDIRCLLQRYLEHWGTFFTQQHVVARISEICRPHAPVTTAGVDNSESVIHLMFVHGDTIHPAFQPSDDTDWLIEHGLMYQQTHYRSYRGRIFSGQMTQPTVSKHWRKIGPKE